MSIPVECSGELRGRLDESILQIKLDRNLFSKSRGKWLALIYKFQTFLEYFKQDLGYYNKYPIYMW